MVFINTYFPALENNWKKAQKYTHLASPSGNPPSGQCYFWCKSDNKMYVKDSSGNEAEIGGIDSSNNFISFKQSVVTSASSNKTLSGEQTLDTILTSNSRVLMYGQTDASENGIYVTSSGAWTRATDLDTSDKMKSGICIVVQKGNANALKIFMLTTVDPIVLDTDNLAFIELGGQVGNSALEGSIALSKLLTPPEANATADQTDTEVQQAYFNEVPLATQVEAEAGTVNSNRRFTPERIKQAIDALAGSSVVSEKVVALHSSVIGDYTKPDSATASSNNAEVDSNNNTHNHDVVSTSGWNTKTFGQKFTAIIGDDIKSVKIRTASGQTGTVTAYVYADSGG